MIFWWIRMTLANGHQMCEFDLADPRLLTCFCLLRDVKPVMVWRNDVKFPPWGPGWVGSWWMIIWGWCDEVPPGQMNLIFSIQITTIITFSIFEGSFFKSLLNLPKPHQTVSNLFQNKNQANLWKVMWTYSQFTFTDFVVHRIYREEPVYP